MSKIRMSLKRTLYLKVLYAARHTGGPPNQYPHLPEARAPKGVDS